jgi:hypothetical protein
MAVIERLPQALLTLAICNAEIPPLLFRRDSHAAPPPTAFRRLSRGMALRSD